MSDHAAPHALLAIGKTDYPPLRKLAEEQLAPARMPLSRIAGEGGAGEARAG